MVSTTYSFIYTFVDSIGPRTIALEFDPDRWLDERVKKYLIPNPYIFLPFNAGPRICLGQQVCRSFIIATHLMPPFFTSVCVQRNVVHGHSFTAKLFHDYTMPRTCDVPTCVVG
jgi:hypothetical protein